MITKSHSKTNMFAGEVLMLLKLASPRLYMALFMLKHR